MHEFEHISIYIQRRPDEVYQFASNPENLPLWAAGLATSRMQKNGDKWLAEFPFGKVSIRFAQINNFGVMDHDVELDSGTIVHNPMRVISKGDGSFFMFTLFRQPVMTDEQFVADKLAVQKDLATLKLLLERDY